MTVVLSVVSRSVTDITVSTYEEDALRAFSAAEAGIEEALLKGTTQDPEPVPIENDVEYDVKVEDKTVTDKRYRYPKDLVSGETATFWFVSHDANGNLICDSTAGKPCFIKNTLNLCWGNPTASVVPAIEVTYYYDTSSGSMTIPNNFTNVKVKRFAFDENHSARGNNFNDTIIGSGCTIGSDQFRYRANINVNTDVAPSCDSNSGCSIMAKIRMYYATAAEPQRIGMWTTGPASDIPSQGFLIDSKGSAGESTRRINVFQSFPEPPSFFDATVFSRQDLVKN